MGTLSNSEDPDEMPHDAAFYLGLHCLLRLKHFSEKEIEIYLEIITCGPSLYTMNHPEFIVLYQMEEPIRIQGVKMARGSLFTANSEMSYYLFLFGCFQG